MSQRVEPKIDDPISGFSDGDLAQLLANSFLSYNTSVDVLGPARSPNNPNARLVYLDACALRNGGLYLISESFVVDEDLGFVAFLDDVQERAEGLKGKIRAAGGLFLRRSEYKELKKHGVPVGKEVFELP